MNSTRKEHYTWFQKPQEQANNQNMTGIIYMNKLLRAQQEVGAIASNEQTNVLRDACTMKHVPRKLATSVRAAQKLSKIRKKAHKTNEELVEKGSNTWYTRSTYRKIQTNMNSQRGLSDTREALVEKNSNRNEKHEFSARYL